MGEPQLCSLETTVLKVKSYRIPDYLGFQHKVHLYRKVPGIQQSVNCLKIHKRQLESSLESCHCLLEFSQWRARGSPVGHIHSTVFTCKGQNVPKRSQAFLK